MSLAIAINSLFEQWQDGNWIVTETFKALFFGITEDNPFCCQFYLGLQNINYPLEQTPWEKYQAQQYIKNSPQEFLEALKLFKEIIEKTEKQLAEKKVLGNIN